jgi:hypothetical protein
VSRRRTRTSHGGHEGPPWLDPLIAKGEIRLGWQFSDETWNRAAWTAMGLGAWGIVTGYALFLLLWHERHHPWKLLVALLFAALASFVVEATRGLILGHKSERMRGPRLVVTILTLAIVELFVIAVHSVAIPSAASFARVRDVVFGEVVSKHVPVAVSLASIMSIWVLVGALLAGVLMYAVPEGRGSTRARVAKSATLGAFVGAVVAPIALLLVVLLIRLIGMIAILFTAPSEWADHLRALRESHPIVGTLMVPLEWLGDLWGWHPLGPVPVGPVLTIVVLVTVLRGIRDKKPLRVAFVVVVGLVLVPVFFRGFGALLQLLGLAALVWFVPSAAIGGLAPALRRPSEDTRTWGLVAFLAGAALAALTFARLLSWWFLLPAVLLFFTWLVLRRGARMNDYWPLVGLTAALVVSGFTWAGQMTFAGVFTRFHEISDVDLLLKPSTKPAVLDDTQLKVLAWLQRRNAGPEAALNRLAELRFGTGAPGSGLVERGLGGLSTAPGLASDAELDARASTTAFGLTATAPSEVASLHAEWKTIQLGPGSTEDRIAAKRALLARVAPKVVPGASALLRGSPRHRYFEALDARLRADLAEADAVLALEREWRAAETAPGGGRLADAASLWGRARDLRGRARTAEAVAILDRLVPEVAREIDALEAKAGQDLESAVAALDGLADPDERFDAGTALAATARAAAAHAATEDGRRAIEALADRAETLGREARDRQRVASRRLLELCLCASLGFWVSVGMLAGLSLLRTRGRLVHGKDGKRRCFWGDAPALRAYHDEVHGTAPACDGELFARLGRELLAPAGKGPVDAAAFDGFDPAKLAAREPPAGAGAGRFEVCDRRWVPGAAKPLACTPEGTTLVLESARRLQAWYESVARERGLNAVPDARGAALLDDLRARAGTSGPESAVARLVELFCLRKATPAATFLQAAGILPGAHHEGCDFGAEREHR